MTARTLTVDGFREREREADRLVAEGYRVTHVADEETRLRERNRGSWVWHLIFLFLTAGLGNVAYALKNYVQADRVHVVEADA